MRRVVVSLHGRGKVTGTEESSRNSYKHHGPGEREKRVIPRAGDFTGFPPPHAVGAAPAENTPPPTPCSPVVSSSVLVMGGSGSSPGGSFINDLETRAVALPTHSGNGSCPAEPRVLPLPHHPLLGCPSPDDL